MKYERNEYTLASGRTFYAHQGILGLNDDLDELYNGYDGTVWLEDETGQPLDGLPFTDGERREIATHMITLWAKWGRIP